MDRIRAFIAIPLPALLLGELASLQRRLEDQMPPRCVRWVRPEGIHLTLKFLGDTPVDRLPDIGRALKSIAQDFPRHTFAVAGMGCFPDLRRPRVVWVGVRDVDGHLGSLQKAVEEAMIPFGFAREGRAFTPHLTLGRVGERVSSRDVARVGEVVAATEAGLLGEVTADRFALFRSELKPTGAEYTVLEEFPLRGG
ncbi:MAG: RNA 2',3'-cyclic phosphodiesterase [Anaerolineae bacterium]|nr:RNA 2',3'-cyclic phosphodiesterase [Anaerolineae bacterium]